MLAYVILLYLHVTACNVSLILYYIIILVYSIYLAVPYGQSCEIDGVDKDCIRDSYCDYITKTCVCPEGSTWMEGYLNCVHDGGKYYM